MKYTEGDTPFETENVKLAFCLYSAGVPFFSTAKPCINLYLPDRLKAIEGTKGMTYEDAVRHALRNRQPGQVKYLFKRTPDLGILIDAFNDQIAKLKDEDGDGATMIESIFEQQHASRAERLVRLSAVTLEMRKQFLELWREVDPDIAIMESGEPVTNGNVTKFPGFTIVSLSASKETKERLGV